MEKRKIEAEEKILLKIVKSRLKRTQKEREKECVCKKKIRWCEWEKIFNLKCFKRVLSYKNRDKDLLNKSRVQSYAMLTQNFSSQYLVYIRRKTGLYVWMSNILNVLRLNKKCYMRHFTLRWQTFNFYLI